MTDTAEPKRKSVWRRRTLGVFATVFTVVVVAFAALQIPPVKGLIASRIAASLPWPAKIEGLGGWLPFSITVEQISLGPEGTAWLTLRDAALDIGILPLLGGTLQVERIAAGEITLLRLPPSSPPTEAPLGLPVVTDLPPWLHVEQLTVERFALGEAVAGRALAFSMTGAYRPGTSAPVELRVQGLDGADLQAELTGGLRDGVVDLALSAQDDSLVETMTGTVGPFEVSLRLDGPLADASLALDLTRATGDLLSLNGKLGYGLPLKLEGVGILRLPEEFAAPALRARTGDSLEFDIALDLTADRIFRIHRAVVDGAQARVEVAGNYALRGGAINLTPLLRAADLHLLAGQPREGDPVALVARLPLTGTLKQLQITPEFTLNDMPWLSGTLALDLADEQALKGHLNVQPASELLPESVRDLLSRGAEVTVDGTYAAGRARIAQARLVAGNTLLDARGDYDVVARLMELEATLQLNDLADFSAIARRPLAGAVSVEVSASGDPEKTTATGALVLREVTSESIHAPGGRVAFTLLGGAFPDRIDERVVVTLDGALPELQLQPRLKRDLVLKGSATIEALRGIVVDAFELSDGNFVARADGNVDVESRDADFNATLDIAQIADYGALTGVPGRGRVRLGARAYSGEAPGTVVAEITGGLSGLSGLPEGIQSLTGRDAKLSASVTYDGAVLDLPEVAWSSDVAKLSGTGTYQLGDKNLSAKLSGDLDDIQGLSAMAKRPLAGKARFTLTAEGETDNFASQGSIQGEGLRADTFRARQADITFDAAGLPGAPEVALNARLAQGDESLQLNAALRKSDQEIMITTFDAAAGDNRLSAEGAVRLDTRRGHGTLSVSLPKLEALKTWSDLPFAGSLKLQADISKDSGRLSAAIKGESLVLPGASIAQLDATGDIGDPFASPSGSLAVRVADGRAGDWRVDTLDLSADGPGGLWSIALKSTGAFRDQTMLQVAGTAALAPAEGGLMLNTLTLSADDQVFTLRQPASLSRKGDVVTITALSLAADTGSVTLDGVWRKGAVDLRANVDALPLVLAALGGVDPPGGTLSGDVVLGGSPAAPTIDATLRIAGYNPDPEGEEDFAGLDAEVAATYGAGALQASVSATVPDELRLEGRAAVDADWRLQPWRFAVPRDGVLRGALKSAADLDTLPPLLGLEGQEIRGRFEADLTLGGTLASPALNGTASVVDGYYENGATSTILNNLHAEAEAQGNTLRITSFSADDGADGKYRGEGQLSLEPAGHTPFYFALTLNQPRVIHRDDLRAQGEGTLRIEGDEKGAIIQGDLRVGSANITLPERTVKTRVATVPYTIKGQPRSEEEDGPRGPWPITLDVRAELPGRVFFRGPGLDSEWAGALRATGDARNPSIRGTLNVKKGTLEFLGRPFNLAESTISFDGETPPAPFLRIVAVTEADDIVARVRIEGLHTALNITLESEPPMPRDEILSRVLFGQRLSEVSPVQALTLARYAPVFSKNATAQTVLGSGAPNPQIVDRFTVRGGSGVGEASITTGKYLTDDLYLEFEQGLGSAESLVSLEWLFAPEWSLKARTTSQGEGGVGVFWKRNY